MNKSLGSSRCILAGVVYIGQVCWFLFEEFSFTMISWFILRSDYNMAASSEAARRSPPGEYSIRAGAWEVEGEGQLSLVLAVETSEFLRPGAGLPRWHHDSDPRVFKFLFFQFGGSGPQAGRPGQPACPQGGTQGLATPNKHQI